VGDETRSRMDKSRIPGPLDQRCGRTKLPGTRGGSTEKRRLTPWTASRPPQELRESRYSRRRGLDARGSRVRSDRTTALTPVRRSIHFSPSNSEGCQRRRSASRSSPSRTQRQVGSRRAPPETELVAGSIRSARATARKPRRARKPQSDRTSPERREHVLAGARCAPLRPLQRDILSSTERHARRQDAARAPAFSTHANSACSLL
jgi:hypothetical protein